MQKIGLPKEIFVYEFDTVDGQSLYAIATKVDEIPADIDGQVVSVYALNRTYKFSVRRVLL